MTSSSLAKKGRGLYLLLHVQEWELLVLVCTCVPVHIELDTTLLVTWASWGSIGTIRFEK